MKRSAIEDEKPEAECRLNTVGNETGTGSGGILEVFRGRGDRLQLLVDANREIGNGGCLSSVRPNQPGTGSAREIPRSVEGRGWGHPTLKQAKAEAAKFH